MVANHKSWFQCSKRRKPENSSTVITIRLGRNATALGYWLGECFAIVHIVAELPTGTAKSESEVWLDSSSYTCMLYEGFFHTRPP